MPSALIEVRQQYSAEVESEIMEAVHAALREAFKILPGDRNVRLLVHEPHRFQCPPDREKPEYYTHISIDCFAGRSLEAKRKLYKAIVADPTGWKILKLSEKEGIDNHKAARKVIEDRLKAKFKNPVYNERNGLC